jgi:hypothetical protein
LTPTPFLQWQTAIRIWNPCFVSPAQSPQPGKVRRMAGSFNGKLPRSGCRRHTAEHYAEVRADLRKRGQPIPGNDVWLAALARQHALPILSRDRHFDFVPGLRRISW